MGIKAKRVGGAFLALSVVAAGAAGVADAASTKGQQTRHHRPMGGRLAGGPHGLGRMSPERDLTGAILASASAAASASVSGGTVLGATIEDPNHHTGAAYEVHMRKADGSRVDVLEDGGFKVLSVTAAPSGGPGGRGGKETAVTGATLASVSSSAIAALAGGKVTAATIEDPGHKTGATYEAHVTKADGSMVEVLEDGTFKVLSIDAGPPHGGAAARGMVAPATAAGH